MFTLHVWFLNFTVIFKMIHNSVSTKCSSWHLNLLALYSSWNVWDVEYSPFQLTTERRDFLWAEEHLCLGNNKWRILLLMALKTNVLWGGKVFLHSIKVNEWSRTAACNVNGPWEIKFWWDGLDFCVAFVSQYMELLIWTYRFLPLNSE